MLKTIDLISLKCSEPNLWMKATSSPEATTLTDTEAALETANSGKFKSQLKNIEKLISLAQVTNLWLLISMMLLKYNSKELKPKQTLIIIKHSCWQF